MVVAVRMYIGEKKNWKRLFYHVLKTLFMMCFWQVQTWPKVCGHLTRLGSRFIPTLLLYQHLLSWKGFFFGPKFRVVAVGNLSSFSHNSFNKVRHWQTQCLSPRCSVRLRSAGPRLSAGRWSPFFHSKLGEPCLYESHFVQRDTVMLEQVCE